MRYRLLAVATLVSLGSVAILGQAPAPPAASSYLLPPKVIIDILDAPPPPIVELSPARDVVALLERTSMPTIAELAQPMLRLAGVRINPKTNAPHRSNSRYRHLTLKVVADSSERKVTLPASPVLSWVGFSPDGRRFAFTNMRDNTRSNTLVALLDLTMTGMGGRLLRSWIAAPLLDIVAHVIAFLSRDDKAAFIATVFERHDDIL